MTFFSFDAKKVSKRWQKSQKFFIFVATVIIDINTSVMTEKKILKRTGLVDVYKTGLVDKVQDGKVIKDKNGKAVKENALMFKKVDSDDYVAVKVTTPSTTLVVDASTKEIYKILEGVNNIPAEIVGSCYFKWIL